MSNFASGYIKYINHLEQINDAALLNPQVMIDEVEDSYHEHIENIARNIVTHYKTAKVCMLAGPSSSGKTTTAHLLQRELGKLGVHAEIVSLDDFYLGPNAAMGYITMFSALTNSWAFARLLRLKTQAVNSRLRRKTSRPLILLTPVMSLR